MAGIYESSPIKISGVYQEKLLRLKRRIRNVKSKSSSEVWTFFKSFQPKQSIKVAKLQENPWCEIVQQEHY